MNDWRAKGRQEYALGAIAMGQWGPAEHMGTMGNGDLTPLDLQGETCSQTKEVEAIFNQKSFGYYLPLHIF